MKQRARGMWSEMWLAVFGLCAAAGCKESMHPAQESQDTQESAPAAKLDQTPPPAAAKTPDKSAPAATKAAPTSAATKEVTSDGYEVVRATGHATGQDGENADVAVKAPEGWKVTTPPDSPDPHAGKFALPEALKGLPGKGQLNATIHTSLGTLHCELFEDKAPVTVANFVGLARGTRKFWSGKDHAWVSRPYYDGTTFHRVIPGFMIQGGDWQGDGAGGMYYKIPDELDPSLKHDRGGQLCMANRGPNTNEAQFFITEAAAPHLDGSYTIFGQCSPNDLVYRIARVPQGVNNRPLTPVNIEKITIDRGAAHAASEPSKDSPLPKNTVPGVAPPGQSLKVPNPHPTEATPPK
jgi:peptidyl-prolyl cis-trans isomerase A (cyclophilin A)